MKIIASLVLYKHSRIDIENTLLSLFSESTIDKVCIVDNGSYCTWLEALNHPKIDIIRLPTNKGFGSGHNAVFRKFSGQYDYFLVCNPDIYFSRGEVDRLYRFSRNNNIGLTIPKVVYPDGTLQYGCKLLPKPYQLFLRRFFSSLAARVNYNYELHGADYTSTFFAPSLSGCFMLLSQEALHRVNGFDERFFLYLEDVDLSRRVCNSELLVQYCPDAVVIHESQRRSYRNVKFLFYHIASAVRYFNKWGWFSDRQRDFLNSRCLSELPLLNKISSHRNTTTL